MVGNGTETDEQFVRHYLVASASGHQHWDLDLPWRQPVQIPGRGFFIATAVRLLRRIPLCGSEFVSGIEMLVRLGISSLSPEQQAEIIVVLRVAGTHPQQPQLVRFGGFKIASHLQKDRQVVDRLGILGPEP